MHSACERVVLVVVWLLALEFALTRSSSFSAPTRRIHGTWAARSNSGSVSVKIRIGARAAAVLDRVRTGRSVKGEPDTVFDGSGDRGGNAERQREQEATDPSEHGCHCLH